MLFTTVWTIDELGIALIVGALFSFGGSSRRRGLIGSIASASFIGSAQTERAVADLRETIAEIQEIDDQWQRAVARRRASGDPQAK